MLCAPEDVAFSAEEYASRIQHTREQMARSGLDLLLVSGPENIYWLSGYRNL